MKMKKALICSLALAIVGASRGDSTEVRWDASSPVGSLADGKVVLSFDDTGAITAVTASLAERDEIAILGDAFRMADGAVVTVRPVNASKACLRLENAIEGAGAVSFLMDKSAQPESNATGQFRNDSDSLPATVLEGARLDELDLLSCRMGWSGSGFDVASTCLPYHVVRSEGALEAQMQVNDGKYLKVGKLRLEQRGDAVVLVGYSYFRYAENGYSANAIGCDFDAKQPKADDNPAGYVETRAGTYYLGDFVFRRMTRDVDVLVADSLTAISVMVGEDVHLIADGSKALSGGSDYAVPLSLDGVLEIRNRESIRLSGPIDGRGELFCSSNGVGEVVRESCERVVEMDIPSETLTSGNVPVPLMVAYGFELAQLHGIRDVSIVQKTAKEEPVGEDIGEPDGLKGVYLWENDGEKATCQVQAIADDGTCVKGLKVEFTEANGGIVARSWSFWQNTASALGTDMTQDGNHQNGGAYKITKMTLVFAEGSRQTGSNIILSGTNTMSTGMLRVKGGEGSPTKVTIENSRALPKSGTDILENGEVVLAQKDDGYLVAGTKISVCVGGTFRQQKLASLENEFGNQNNGVKIVVNGGSYDVGLLASSDWGDNGPYLNRMTFANGGHIYGQGVRLGGTVVEWIVSGSGTATCDNILYVRGNPKDSSDIQQLTFCVDDTSGDGSPDLKINAPIKNMVGDGGFRQGQIVKTGDGTVLHAGANSFNYHPIVIRGGIWMAGSPSALPLAQDISLDGGCVGVAGGIDVNSGKVTISEVGGGFVVVDGATLSVPAPTDGDWSEGAPIRIDLGIGSRLRIGTRACLSRRQLSGIQIARVGLAPGRYHAEQDDAGYVDAVRYGLAIVIR